MTDDITNDGYVSPDRDAKLGAEVDRAADELHNAQVQSSTEIAVVPADNVAVADRWTVRLVVIALTSVVLLVIVAQVVLSLKDRTLPDQLLTLAAVGVGALGSLLASIRSAPR